MTLDKENTDVRSVVREKYGEYAEKLADGQVSSCCGSQEEDIQQVEDSSCCGSEEDVPQTVVDKIAHMYQDPDAADLPEDITNLSLGCGDPVTLASLEPGQTVLDLGSGGGIDCFLAAKKVGPEGRVIGVDMTPTMLEKARANKRKVGAGNVEFRLGEIEYLPVADDTVDVIISNCVINLSPDKPQVLREAFRVLKPGGKAAISDIVTDGPLPPEIKSSLSAWAGCVAGALEADEYTSILREVGFENIELEPVYFSKEMVDEAADQIESIDTSQAGDEIYKAVYSARITASKPA